MAEMALTGLIEKFLSILSSDLKSTIKITPGKKISCLSDTFEIFAIFEILAIFEISNANYGQMTIIMANFFS